MGRLQSYLLEYQSNDFGWPKAGRGKSLSKSEAYKIIDKHCRKTSKLALDGYRIYRYTNSKKGDYVLVDTKGTKPRMSLNTTNYYTIIINDDPSWSNFPKRNIIASTETRVSGEGNYVVLPFDGQGIGVAQSFDIWPSFTYLPAYDASDFNRHITSLLVYADANPSKINSIESLKAAAAKFDKKYKEYDSFPEEDGRELPSFVRDSDVLGNKYDGDLYKTLVDWFNPKANNFKLKKAGQMLLKGKEVWFDGPSVWIELSTFYLDIHAKGF